MKVHFKTFLIITFYFIATFAFTRSAEQNVFSDINQFVFGKDIKETELFFNKNNPKQNALIKVLEGFTEKELKKEYYPLTQRDFNIYDEDFFIINKNKEYTLSLNHINDYALSQFFPTSQRSSLIKDLRFTFFQDKLYIKKATLLLPKPVHALNVLKNIKMSQGQPQIKDNKIYYNGYNRFVWNTKAYKIEYIFYPAKNMYSQNIGYTGILRITNHYIYRKANAHITTIKRKLRNIFFKNANSR